MSTEGKLPAADAEQVQGQTINHISRLGKYIIFKLDTGYLISHLRMTGQWHYSEKGSTPHKDKHFRWGFTMRGHNGEFSGFLWFKDVRRFGTLEWVPSLLEYEPFSRTGPDGLTLMEPKVLAKVVAKASSSKRSIKNFLLDQSVLAGSGNIYSSETLYETSTNPKSITSTLSPEKIKNIYLTLYEIFNRSIALGGTSISDHAGGHYQNALKVYGREGELCDACSSKIKKIIQSGRSTFYCPSCQED